MKTVLHVPLIQAALAREQFEFVYHAPQQIQFNVVEQAVWLSVDWSVPVVHHHCIVLLHVAAGQAALALLQAVAVVLVPPLTPLHHHVEFPPQDPATLDAVVPPEQAY